VIGCHYFVLQRKFGTQLPLQLTSTTSIANLPSNEAFHPYLLTYKDLIGIGYKFSNQLNLPIFPLLKARIALRFATKSPEHERQCTIANA
jgi:hypothetical protein